MSRKLSQYLKSSRRRAGLAQSDVAMLIGDRTASRISRHERGRRLPTLETALAYQAIFGVSVAELFAGSYRTIARRVANRAKNLADRSGPKNAALAMLRQRSLRLLMNR